MGSLEFDNLSNAFPYVHNHGGPNGAGAAPNSQPSMLKSIMQGYQTTPYRAEATDVFQSSAGRQSTGQSAIPSAASGFFRRAKLQFGQSLTHLKSGFQQTVGQYIPGMSSATQASADSAPASAVGTAPSLSIDKFLPAPPDPGSNPYLSFASTTVPQPAQTGGFKLPFLK